MRSTSAGMAAHLAGEVTSLAICWQLTLTDTTVMGFTDHTADLTVGSQLYKAATGFAPTSIESQDNFAVDNLDVAGILDSASITEADIMAGKYDFAEILIFMVNVTDLTQGSIIHRRGWLGEVSLKNGQFIAEVRGLAQKLQQNIGELFSPTCRAVLGDGRCKVALSGFSATGAVSTVTSRQVFTSSSMTQAAGYFSGGEVQWLTGANAGRRMEIKEFSNTQFTLVLPMPNSVAATDTFKAIAGCDKTFTTCYSKFSNAVNFRGEPNIRALRVGGWISSRSARRSMPRSITSRRKIRWNQIFCRAGSYGHGMRGHFLFFLIYPRCGRMEGTGKPAIGCKASWGFQTSARSSLIS